MRNVFQMQLVIEVYDLPTKISYLEQPDGLGPNATAVFPKLGASMGFFGGASLICGEGIASAHSIEEAQSNEIFMLATMIATNCELVIAMTVRSSG
jgi:hypothetical protein